MDALTLNTYSFVTPNGYANQNTYSTADIGVNTYIQLQLVGVSYSNIDVVAWGTHSYVECHSHFQCRHDVDDAQVAQLGPCVFLYKWQPHFLHRCDGSVASDAFARVSPLLA